MPIQSGVLRSHTRLRDLVGAGRSPFFSVRNRSEIDLLAVLYVETRLRHAFRVGALSDDEAAMAAFAFASHPRLI